CSSILLQLGRIKLNLPLEPLNEGYALWRRYLPRTVQVLSVPSHRQGLVLDAERDELDLHLEAESAAADGNNHLLVPVDRLHLQQFGQLDLCLLLEGGVFLDSGILRILRLPGAGRQILRTANDQVLARSIKGNGADLGFVIGKAE